jgi:SnoaL-like domain
VQAQSLGGGLSGQSLEKTIDPEVAAVLDSFYGAFLRQDAVTMGSLYHPQASFSDPVFPDIRGATVEYMWRMFCSETASFTLTYEILFADERKAQVEWVAGYKWQGRMIKNQVLSTLSLWDGLIVRQIDEFDFPVFARQAFGLKALVLGHTAHFRQKIQVKAKQRLNQFIIADSVQ